MFFSETDDAYVVCKPDNLNPHRARLSERFLCVFMSAVGVVSHYLVGAGAGRPRRGRHGAWKSESFSSSISRLKLFYFARRFQYIQYIDQMTVAVGP